MADQPESFLSALLHRIAEGVGVGTATARAAQQEAHEARLAAERGGKARSPFDVLAGLRPKNAKTITAMLAGGVLAPPSIPSGPPPLPWWAQVQSQSEMAIGHYDPQQPAPQPAPNPLTTRAIYATGKGQTAQRPTISQAATSLYQSLPPVVSAGPPPLPGSSQQPVVSSFSAIAGQPITSPPPLPGLRTLNSNRRAASGLEPRTRGFGSVGFRAGQTAGNIAGTAVSIVALTTAAWGAVKSISAITGAYLEHNRELARWHGGLSVMYSKMERQKLVLGSEYAKATGGTQTALGTEWMKLQNEIQPLTQALGNLTNAWLGGMTIIARQLVPVIETVTSPLMLLAELLKKLTPSSKEKPLLVGRLEAIMQPYGPIASEPKNKQPRHGPHG